MKTIVLGDTHGRTSWEDIIKIEKDFDKVVFLGDYLSSHEGISEIDQIENFKKILEFKTKTPDKVVLLRGNHDLEAIGYIWAECYPIFKNNWARDNEQLILDNTDWVYIDGNKVFSHAGISTVWFERLQSEYPFIKDISDINKLEPNGSFAFTPGKMSDYYGITSTQPLTWIRPVALIECAYKPDTYIQIVGHSPVKRISNTKTVDSKYPNIWLCDNLPSEYLIIEDDEFIVKSLVS